MQASPVPGIRDKAPLALSPAPDVRWALVLVPSPITTGYYMKRLLSNMTLQYAFTWLRIREWGGRRNNRARDMLNKRFVNRCASSKGLAVRSPYMIITHLQRGYRSNNRTRSPSDNWTRSEGSETPLRFFSILKKLCPITATFMKETDRSFSWSCFINAVGAMLRLFITSILFLFHAHVYASEPGVFLNPPTGGPIHDYTQDPKYDLGETVQLRWATNINSFSIILWQNDNSEYEVVQSMPVPACLPSPACFANNQQRAYKTLLRTIGSCRHNVI